MARALWLVLDSLGIGGAVDAAAYGDAGADTFGHIAEACARAPRGPLRIPHLARLGLPQVRMMTLGQSGLEAVMDGSISIPHQAIHPFATRNVHPLHIQRHLA